MNTRRNVLLGAFLLIGLIAITVATLFLKDRLPFESRREWTVYFGADSIVEEGFEVYSAGMKVGHIDQVDPVAEADYTPRRQVRAIVSIREDITVWRGAELVVRPRGFLGGYRAELRRGSPELGVLPSNEIPGRIEGGVSEQISGMVSENRASLMAIMENLKVVTESLAEGRGTAGALIKNPELFDHWNRIGKELAEFAEGLNQGWVGQRLRDPAFGRKIEDVVDNVRAFSNTLTRGEFARLLDDEEFVGRIRKITASLEKLSTELTSKRGTIGMLLNDEATAADVRAMIKAGRDFAEALTSERGTVGALLSDDRLYRNLLTVSREFRFVAEDLNAGKGSLGKLLKNDGVYNELQRMLESFRESGDIARENIVLGSLTSFTSLFFNVLN